ncbi:MAG: molybdopterin-dependent oxidoreductase [Acidobacteriia bacterium]|nr:molybdopterin-dependent oxidoreductase [Terriglobia bacterium]
MREKISRRDLLRLAGGSALGLWFTPIPWKLLDDVSIWTQNGRWVTSPPRGEIQFRYSNCTLCPAGCGVRARCVGGQPISLAGIAPQSGSRGALCAVGLGGHHLRYHPQRVTQPLRRASGISASFQPCTPEDIVLTVSEALATTRASGSGDLAAILDERPGRVTSLMYRNFLSGFPNGVYLNPVSDSGATLHAMESAAEKPYGALGIDLENTRTILSFGTPLLDGWGNPARLWKMSEGLQDSSESHLKIIQAETHQSRTALLADEWLPLRPGTEAALALGLAGILIKEKLIDMAALSRQAIDLEQGAQGSFRELTEKFSPRTTAAITGVSEDKIVSLARELVQRGPSIVLGGGDPGAGPLGPEEETAIAALNFVLGNVGRRGGFLPRRELPKWLKEPSKNLKPASSLRDIPDHSIRVLFVDALPSGNAIPWTLLEKKLVRDNPVVVSFSPYLLGISRNAQFIVPSPVYLESWEEVLTPLDSPTTSYSLSLPLLVPPGGVQEPFDFIRRVAVAAGVHLAPEFQDVSPKDLFKRRVEQFHRDRRGTIFSYRNESETRVKDVASADSMWAMFCDGASWRDDPPSSTSPIASRFSLLGKAANAAERLEAVGHGRLEIQRDPATEFPLVLMPEGWRGAVGQNGLSPVMTKIYQESGLRHLGGEARVNVETGRRWGLTDGGPALIQTRCGSKVARVHFDDAVMPEVIQVIVGPNLKEFHESQEVDGRNILCLCNLDDDGVWRVTRAKMSGV